MSHSAPAHSTPPLKMGLAIPDSKLCLWLFLGTEIMFFTAFIGTYIVLRMGSPGWPSDPHDTHINVRAGGINTFVLIFSSYLVVVAHEAMHEENFKKAWNCMLAVLVAGFVFLGIKGFEYYGKFAEDIVPGHIAENDQQALQKFVVEFTASRDAMVNALYVPAEDAPEATDTAAKLAALRDELTAGPADQERRAELEALFRLNDRIGSNFAVITTNAAGEETVNSDPTHIAKVQADYEAAIKTHEEAVATATAANETPPDAPPAPDIAGLAAVVRREILPLHTGPGHDLNPHFQRLYDETSNDTGIADYLSVHKPHPLPYGNVFASVYFLMTGFHAIHVIVGMILWGLVLAKGEALDGSWSDFVENSGLYWHFVDLVWIFLFPLIYIVNF